MIERQATTEQWCDYTSKNVARPFEASWSVITDCECQNMGELWWCHVLARKRLFGITSATQQPPEGWSWSGCTAMYMYILVIKYLINQLVADDHHKIYCIPEVPNDLQLSISCNLWRDSHWEHISWDDAYNATHTGVAAPTVGLLA